VEQIVEISRLISIDKCRLDKAKFRELATLEGFDWQFNAKGLDRRIIEQLVTCDFVRRSQNVILVGQTGFRGKID
jgi:IstB-like ATP binding protein